VRIRGTVLWGSQARLWVTRFGTTAALRTPRLLAPYAADGCAPKWGCRNPPDFWEGLPVIARGVSKSG